MQKQVNLLCKKALILLLLICQFLLLYIKLKTKLLFIKNMCIIQVRIILTYL